VLPTVLLLTVLAAYVGAQVLRHAVRVLQLDVWEALVYLGLAELDGPPAPRPVRPPLAG
jgi:fumarate reductase subunit D